MSLIALFVASSCTFAADLQCPPIEKMRSAEFYDAIQWFHSPEWIITGNSFTDNGVEWIFAADVISTDVKDKDQALEFARNQLKTATLHDPEQRQYGDETDCEYTNDHVFALLAVNAPSQKKFLH